MPVCKTGSFSCTLPVLENGFNHTSIMPTFNVLVTDEVDPDGVALLRAEPGFHVDERPTTPFRELVDVIGEYDAIVGRSATQVPAELLRHARRLQVIGRAGVG